MTNFLVRGSAAVLVVVVSVCLPSRLQAQEPRSVIEGGGHRFTFVSPLDDGGIVFGGHGILGRQRALHEGVDVELVEVPGEILLAAAEKDDVVYAAGVRGVIVAWDQTRLRVLRPGRVGGRQNNLVRPSADGVYVLGPSSAAHVDPTGHVEEVDPLEEPARGFRRAAGMEGPPSDVACSGVPFTSDGRAEVTLVSCQNSVEVRLTGRGWITLPRAPCPSIIRAVSVGRHERDVFVSCETTGRVYRVSGGGWRRVSSELEGVEEILLVGEYLILQKPYGIFSVEL